MLKKLTPFFFMNTNQILNVAMHSATMLMRFLFLFALAKLISTHDFGVYGLFAAAIGYALYFVGLDFYTFSTREIAKAEHDKIAGLLKSKLVLFTLLHLLWAPIFALVIYSFQLPNELIFWFYPLLFFEHFNLEIYRLLVAIQKPKLASFILFTRQIIWVVGMLFVMLWSTEARTLQTVLAMSLISGFVSLSYGAFAVYKIANGGWQSKIQWSWLMAGIKVSSLLLVSTLAVRGIFTLDRFWVEHLTSLEHVGAYVLFLGIASTLLVFLDSAIFSFLYPKLIELRQAQQIEAYQLALNKSYLTTLIYSILFAFISIMLMPVLLTWIEKPIYASLLNFYYPVLSASILQGLSLIPHYDLYAKNRDKVILQAHLLGFCLFVVSAYLLKDFNKTLAIPYALNIAFFAILSWKLICSKLSNSEPLRQ